MELHHNATTTERQQYNKRVINLFNTFLKESEQSLPFKVGSTFDTLTEKELASQKLCQQFAYYLAHSYTSEASKNKEGHVAGSTAVNYLSSFINSIKTKFSNSTSRSTRDFLSCLDKGGAADNNASRWLRGLKAQLKKVTFQRAVKAGEELDHSNEPLYLDDIKLIIAALAKAGTQEVTPPSAHPLLPSTASYIVRAICVLTSSTLLCRLLSANSCSCRCGLQRVALLRLHGYPLRTFATTSSSIAPMPTSASSRRPRRSWLPFWQVPP